MSLHSTCLRLFGTAILLLAFSVASHAQVAKASTASASATKGGDAGAPIISAHLIHQASIGAETLPREGALSARPSDPNGVMALHIPEYLANYRKPLDAAKQDVAMAQGAGVNTFNMLLYPSHLPDSQFASIIHAYWQVAMTQADFKMDVDIWNLAPGDSRSIDRIRDALKLLNDKYGPAWRRYHGRLVVLLNLGNYAQKSTQDAIELNRIFDGVGGRNAVYLVLYNPVPMADKSPALFAMADAYTDWPHSDYANALETVKAGAAKAKGAGKEYWYPVMPSFMQSRPQDGVTPNVREKLGATNFIADWERAIAADAHAVNITTWNDLSEDSALMPESNHAYGFYNLNPYYARWLRAKQQPAIQQAQILLFHHPEPVDAGPAPIRGKRMTAFNWASKTPPTDYLMVVAMLKQPAKVAILLNDAPLAEHSFTAGLHHWLIYKPAAGSSAASYPEESATWSRTILNAPLSDSEVYVQVTSGAGTTTFRSHRPIVDAAGRSDLTVVGDVFRLD